MQATTPRRSEPQLTKCSNQQWYRAGAGSGTLWEVAAGLTVEGLTVEGLAGGGPWLLQFACPLGC